MWEGQVPYVHAVIMLLNYASNLTTSSRVYGLPMCLVVEMIMFVVLLHSTAFNVNCELFLWFYYKSSCVLGCAIKYGAC